MSWWNFPDSPILEDAINNYDGLFVCIAGNGNSNIDVTPNYPASYHLNNMIVVGAINSIGKRPDCSDWLYDEDGNEQGSNYGQSSVDIYAPGDNIISTVYLDEYHSYDGTSMAAPHVAGVAALLLSMKPDLTTSQLKNAILYSADTISITTQDSSTQNVRKLNAYNAVKYIFNNYSSYLELQYGTRELQYNIDENSSFYMTKNQLIKVSEKELYNYYYVISASNPINIVAYDLNLNPIQISPIYSNYGCTIELSSDLLFGTYFIKINFVSDYYFGLINMQVQGPNHTHNFNGWKYYNISSHIEICDCGYQGTIIKPHIIKQNEIGNTYSICIDCGAKIGNGGGIIITPGINNVPKVTINGSYILNSGIIVLVDKDIPLYLQGKLTFYDYNKKYDDE